MLKIQVCISPNFIENHIFWFGGCSSKGLIFIAAHGHQGRKGLYFASATKGDVVENQLDSTSMDTWIKAHPEATT